MELLGVKNVETPTEANYLQGNGSNISVNFKIDAIHIPPEDITKLEKYPHGSGALYDVWKCTMPASNGIHLVAVKSIRLSQTNDEEWLLKAGKRIRREAYVWITLSHEHILPFEGITEGFGKLPALVSLWMDNGSLSGYLKREFSRLSNHRKLNLIHQVASGLNYLHCADVVHGDLTGTNILVDSSGNLRLADFGLSMIIAEAGNLTFGSVQQGNTRWVAPESLLSPPSDGPDSLLKPTKAGDIYSFGCVMLQILSGEEPYPWITSSVKIISAILRGQDPFHEIEINMDDAYRELSSRCLSRMPEKRPLMLEVVNTIAFIDGRRSILDDNVTSQQLQDYDKRPESSSNNPQHNLNRDVQTQSSSIASSQRVVSGTPTKYNGQGIELHERHLRIVDVSAVREFHKNVPVKMVPKTTKNAAAGVSRPDDLTNSGVTQKSNRISRTDTTAVKSMTRSDLTIQAGCWNRFWFKFFLCCACVSSDSE